MLLLDLRDTEAIQTRRALHAERNELLWPGFATGRRRPIPPPVAR